MALAHAKSYRYRCFTASLIAVANAAAPPKITVKTGLSLSTILSQITKVGLIIMGRAM